MGKSRITLNMRKNKAMDMKKSGLIALIKEIL